VLGHQVPHQLSQTSPLFHLFDSKRPEAIPSTLINAVHSWLGAGTRGQAHAHFCHLLTDERFCMTVGAAGQRSCNMKLQSMMCRMQAMSTACMQRHHHAAFSDFSAQQRCKEGLCPTMLVAMTAICCAFSVCLSRHFVVDRRVKDTQRTIISRLLQLKRPPNDRIHAVDLHCF